MTPPSTPSRHLLLGVCGGIAAYKVAELTSLARKSGWEVRVVMTRAAPHFVGPLTFEALGDHPVMTEVLATGASADGTSAIEHISWAKWADVAVVAPLTASTLGKLACGIADDALTTVWMAVPEGVPCLLAPAMNTAMWEHPVVQRNVGSIDALERYRWVRPVSKRLACGDVGVGGLADPVEILEAAELALAD